MDQAFEKIELSARYIKELNCGHTLQSHDAVVLYRNNGIRTSSVTAANVYSIVLKKAIGTGFYKVLARAFTLSLKLGFILYVWNVAVLCMLIKPDKSPS